MKRSRYAVMFGLLIWSTAAVAALTVSETTDYTAFVSFSLNPNVGTLETGANTVSGSLAGTCTTGPAGCNPPPSLGLGDTQDSFLITVPVGYEITNLTVTTSAVAGPTGFSAGLTVRSPTGIIVPTFYLSPLPGTTGNQLTTPIGSGVYAISVSGREASAAGNYSMSWMVSMTLTSLSVSPEDAISNLIDLISNPDSGLGLTN